MLVSDLVNRLKSIQSTGAGTPDDPYVIGIGQASHTTVTAKAGTAASSGDNTLIAAPGAGFRLVLIQWAWWNETDVETTAILKSATINPIDRYIQTGKGMGKIVPVPTPYGVELAENEALVLNLDGANSHGYELLYLVVVV